MALAWHLFGSALLSQLFFSQFGGFNNHFRSVYTIFRSFALIIEDSRPSSIVMVEESIVFVTYVTKTLRQRTQTLS